MFPDSAGRRLDADDLGVEGAGLAQRGAAGNITKKRKQPDTLHISKHDNDAHTKTIH